MLYICTLYVIYKNIQVPRDVSLCSEKIPSSMWGTNLTKAWWTPNTQLHTAFRVAWLLVFWRGSHGSDMITCNYLSNVAYEAYK